MDFENSLITLYDKSMSFHPRGYFENDDMLRKVLSNEPYVVAESFANQFNYEDAATKYEATDLHKLTKEQSHLSTEQQNDLFNILNEFPTLFAGLNDRPLGVFPNREYHIDLMLGAKAYHVKQPHAVPLNQCAAVKNELL